MNIVIVEDENRVRSFLENALRSEGYTIQACDSFDEALHLLEDATLTFDVIILDRMLHGKEGLELIRPFKRKFPKCFVLILSAIDNPTDKAKALDLGADDYQAKPFSLVELSARIRALGRRKLQSTDSAHGANEIRLRDLCLDKTTLRVTVDGKKLDLSHKEFLLLQTFLLHPGRVYNKYQILDQVWDTQFEIESNVVEVTINNLRRKLERAGSKAEILSKRNIGYWIET